MKPLLRKTLKAYLTYIIVVLAISIPIYYWVIDAIWEHELDEYNSIVANKTTHSFNSLQLSPTELANSLELWNRIQPSTTIRKIQVGESLLDSSFNISRKEPFNKAEKLTASATYPK